MHTITLSTCDQLEVAANIARLVPAACRFDGQTLSFEAKDAEEVALMATSSASNYRRKRDGSGNSRAAAAEMIRAAAEAIRQATTLS